MHKKLLAIGFLSALIILAQPTLVAAQVGGNSQGIGGNSQGIGGSPQGIGGNPGSSDCGKTGMLTNPLNACNIGQLIDEIMKIIINIGTIFLTFMIMVVGFQFVTARGNEEKISSARTALLWTVVGGLLLLGASIIATGIAATVSSL